MFRLPVRCSADGDGNGGLPVAVYSCTPPITVQVAFRDVAANSGDRGSGSLLTGQLFELGQGLLQLPGQPGNLNMCQLGLCLDRGDGIQRVGGPSL